MTTIDPQAAPTLRHGASNDWVAYLQGCLSALGHPTGAPDGDFGPNTRAAVVAFQQAVGLVADGVVGPRTWAAIVAAFNPPGPPGGDAPGGDQPNGHVLDPSRAPTLREGHQGEWVHYPQELLERSGHTPGPIDGIFGPRTAAGVRSFQDANGCDVDGVVGPQTWTALVPVAAVHPTPPPYGTTPTRPGGGGTGGGTVTTDVSAAYDGATTIWFTFPTTNHGSTPVTVKAIEWSVVGPSFNVTDTLDAGEEAAPGGTVYPNAGIPGSPGPEPETITVRAVAVWTDAGGRERRSPAVATGLTLNTDGTITEGPAQKPDPADPKPTVEPRVTVVVGTDAEIDHENEVLGWYVNVHNGTDALIGATGTVYSVQSGPTTLNRSNDNGGPIEPGETVRYSDVVPMGPSGGAPYPVTITAYVELVDSSTQFRSSTSGSVSFTMDGEGVVNGTAHGGGDEPEEPEEPEPGAAPALHLTSELWVSGVHVHGQASLSNYAGTPATAVRLVAELFGSGSGSTTQDVAFLPPGEQVRAQVEATLEESRSGPEHFVLEAYATESGGSYVTAQTAIVVYPDGTIEHS